MEVFSNDKNTIRIDNLSKDIRQYFTKQLVLYIIITFSIISSIVFTTFLIFYYKSKKEIYYLLAFIFATICIILILVRWLWGPFAFIQYYNRFIGSKTNKTREIQQYFYFYLTPIILKGLITIPIYTIMLYSLIPVLFKMQKKYNKKGTSYF
ncbi:hypothetical protein [Mesomycoplasma molare]|uniref:Uncharacterized protein n=1 Tax=Mesomycoplasma molare TaxID=171288 RepID=A0ABY5TVF5_9BACT|nr:hypothetical protein [Mesomycoplasma molare]UWD33991.1 hypothetical protein NX772_02685 [Mesomycoplasma molare]